MSNWNRFAYITVGKILEELHQEGLNITRVTFYRLEKEGLFSMGRTVGGIRRCSRSDANIIKHLIRENYAFMST